MGQHTYMLQRASVAQILGMSVIINWHHGIQHYSMYRKDGKNALLPLQPNQDIRWISKMLCYQIVIKHAPQD